MDLKVKVEPGTVTVEHVLLIVEDEHMILLYVGAQEKHPQVDSYDGVTSDDSGENEQAIWLTNHLDDAKGTRISVQGSFAYSMASPNKYGAHWLLVKEWPGRVYTGDRKPLWTSESSPAREKDHNA